MSRLFFSVAAVLIAASSAHAQGKAQSEPVNIVTADGVKLRGTFYPGMMEGAPSKGAPTVILLHPIGDGKSMSTPEWKTLAESLQKKNYSVMMFDFRGHGDSTTIDDPATFWSLKPNVANVKMNPKDKETINFKDIKSLAGYMPILINDIAAVRSYLDRRNDDNQDCNTSSLIVIGADSAATLGAIWINSEWYRYKFTPDAMFPQIIAKGQFATKPEGNDIIAGVFLTIQPELAKGRTVKVDSQLKIACKDHAMAALFVSGTKGGDFNKGLETKLKKKYSKKHDFIGAYQLKTDLTGIKLIQKGLETDKLIVQYLDNVVDDRKAERTNRAFKDNYYMWKMPAGLIKARNEKAKMTLNFDDYGKFIAP